MARSVTLNGVVYSVPDPGDQGYASVLSDYLAAIPSAVLQKSGGVFSLSAEANFGASFGLQSLYFKTRSATPATSGLVRAAKTDTINWRNNADTGDLALTINALDQLQFAGAILGAGGTVTSVSVTQPAAGLAIAGGPITASGTLVFSLADDLAALEGLGSTGIAVRSAANAWVQRSIVLQPELVGSNLDGVVGNPTLGLSQTGYRLKRVTYITASGIWVKDADVIAVFVRVWGGGGGGGGSDNSAGSTVSIGAGAGAGGYSESWITSLTGNETATVGAGGAGGDALGSNGVNGGNSSFGSHAIANGGALGVGDAVGAATVNRTSSPGTGGTASGGDLNIQGGFGTFGQRSSGASGYSGGGGSAPMGGCGGRSSADGVNGFSGTVPGGGGGGGCADTTTGKTGGAGARGEIHVYEYIR